MDGNPAKRFRYSDLLLDELGMCRDELDHSLRKKLTTLNVHCVLLILECLGDSFTSLNNFATVNAHLCEIAHIWFRIKYRRFDYSMLLPDDHTADHRAVYFEDVHQALQNFGTEMVDVNLDSAVPFPLVSRGHCSRDTLKTLARCCNVAKLRVLTLRGVNRFQHAHDLLTNLTTLTLTDCVFPSGVWKRLQRLRHLILKEVKLISTTPTNDAIYNDYKLETLYVESTRNCNRIYEFVAGMKSLKQLSFVYCMNSDTYFGLCNMQFLERIVLRSRDVRSSKFQNCSWQLLPSLKAAAVHCEHQLIAKFLNCFVVETESRLEHLELRNGLIDDCSASSFACVRGLKSLRLNLMLGMSESHLITIVKGLERLTELWIADANITQHTLQTIILLRPTLKTIRVECKSFILNTDIFHNILDCQIRRASPIVLTLYNDNSQLNVSKELVQHPDARCYFSVVELREHLFARYMFDLQDDEDDDPYSDDDM